MLALLLAGWQLYAALKREAAAALALAGTTDLISRLTEQLKRTTLDLEDAERRVLENRDAIASALKQRDQWGRLYDEQAIAHGNAQAMMMGAIEMLERKLSGAGVSVELPPVIRETQALYLERHVTPVLDRLGTPAVHRAVSPANQPGSSAGTGDQG